MAHEGTPKLENAEFVAGEGRGLTNWTNAVGMIMTGPLSPRLLGLWRT